MIFPLSTWSSHIYVDKVYCKHGDDEEPVRLIYTHHIKSLNNNKRTNVRKVVLIAEQGIIRNNKPNQEENGNKREEIAFWLYTSSLTVLT